MFSWVAIDRFAEKERARDARFRKQNADKVLRSDARNLTDDELLAKLRYFGIELTLLSQSQIGTLGQVEHSSAVRNAPNFDSAFS